VESGRICLRCHHTLNEVHVTLSMALGRMVQLMKITEHVALKASSTHAARVPSNGRSRCQLLFAPVAAVPIGHWWQIFDTSVPVRTGIPHAARP
jgi:hypothetical protein